MDHDEPKMNHHDLPTIHHGFFSWGADHWSPETRTRRGEQFPWSADAWPKNPTGTSGNDVKYEKYIQEIWRYVYIYISEGRLWKSIWSTSENMVTIFWQYDENMMINHVNIMKKQCILGVLAIRGSHACLLDATHCVSQIINGYGWSLRILLW